MRPHIEFPHGRDACSSQQIRPTGLQNAPSYIQAVYKLGARKEIHIHIWKLNYWPFLFEVNTLFLFFFLQITSSPEPQNELTHAVFSNLVGCNFSVGCWIFVVLGSSASKKNRLPMIQWSNRRSNRMVKKVPKLCWATCPENTVRGNVTIHCSDHRLVMRKWSIRPHTTTRLQHKHKWGHLSAGL